jgi:beta-ribofuranosylaminobenzene 5'-phosphate synthase
MDDCRPTVSVSTGARLHFGLLDTRAPFGGIGVMIDWPVTRVSVTSSPRFEAGEIQPSRLTAIARRLAERYIGRGGCNGLPPCRICVESAAPPHRGLGSGTQLALATATALATHFDLRLSRADLVATLAKRGRRSAIGSLGFFEGGLIAEDGTENDFASVQNWRRTELPSAWHVVLARPQRCQEAISGEAEGSAFAALEPAPRSVRENLTRLSDQMMLAAEGGDFESFAVALTQLNHCSGELFAAQQGGCYNGAAVAQLVKQMQIAGAQAYGQSSWGPTLFAFCDSLDAAQELSARLGECVFAIAKPRATGPEIVAALTH